MSTTLAWVTCASARGRDDDEPLALAALAELGVAVDVVDWHDAHVDWARFDRVVIRSAWDYPERIAEFDVWLSGIDTVATVINPLPVMRWSMDKHYLLELAAAGIAVTPTRVVEIGETAALPDDSRGFVVKPAVGAGSRDVVRYGSGEASRQAAQQQIAALHAEGRSVLVQPAIDNVARLGEWPLMFLGGTFSHAAHKRVDLPVHGATDDLFAPETSGPATATPEMIELAESVVRYVHDHVGPTAYARIDVVLDDDQHPVVMEAELVEPSLFLTAAPLAAKRLAEVLTSNGV